MSYRSAGTTRGPLHFEATSSPGLSVASEGRIYFDSGTNRFLVSQNGGAYAQLATAADVGWTDDGTVVRLNTATDQVGMGTATPGAGTKVEIDASAGGFATGLTVSNGALVLTGGAVTASTPVLNATQTWNSGAVTFTGIRLNVTDTASAAASLLADLQVGGSSLVAIGKAGRITRYSGVATSGWGVPAVYASGRSTAQTSAVASVATYTVGAADGSFDVSANLNVTASTTHSISMTVAYTDEGSVARALTLNLFDLNGVALTTVTQVEGAGPYSSPPFRIRCLTGTTITVATTGVFTSVTYNVEATIAQVT